MKDIVSGVDVAQDNEPNNESNLPTDPSFRKETWKELEGKRFIL